MNNAVAISFLEEQSLSKANALCISHYDYFDELLDAAVGSGPEYWNVHQRVSYVWIRER